MERIKDIIVSCKLYIVIALLLFSCKPPTIEDDGGLIYEVEVTYKSDTTELKEILLNRIDYYCHTNPTIDIDKETGVIQIKLPGETDTNKINALILSKGKLEVLETKKFSELEDPLLSINSLLIANDTLRMEFQEEDSLGSEYPLFEVLGQENREFQRKMPILGYSFINDTSRINKLFCKKQVEKIIPKDLDFKWTKFPKNAVVELVITRKPVDYTPMNGNMIEKVKLKAEQYFIIDILFKEEYHETWKSLTGANKEKELAVVIDDKVYSYPVVMDAIKGGKMQLPVNEESIDGSLIVAVLRAPTLKIDYRIKSVKIVEAPK